MALVTLTGAGALAAVLAGSLGATAASASVTPTTLWVANYGGSTITTFSPSDSGNTTPTAEFSTGTQSGPTYEAVDENGDVWVADYTSGDILEFPYDPSTGTVATTPTYGIGGLTTPDGIAFDQFGDLWVSEGGTATSPGQVDTFAASDLGESGTIYASAVFTDGIENPTGIGFDSAGDAWVANDPQNGDPGSLVEFGYAGNYDYHATPTATITSTSYQPSYLTGTATTQDLANPQGLTFEQGNLWLANQGNGTIDEFTESQLQAAASATTPITPQVTIGNVEYSTGGSTYNSLEAPEGVTFDSTGDLWVSNDGDHDSTTSTNYTVVEYTASQIAADGVPTPTDTITSSAFDQPADLVMAAAPGASSQQSGSGPGSGDDTTTQNLWVANYGPPPAAGGVVSFSTSATSGAPASTSPIDDAGGGSTSEVIDGSGNLWVANLGADTVTAYAPGTDGAFGSTPVVTLDGFEEPDGLAFDSNGNLWVSNYTGGSGGLGSVVEIARSSLDGSGTPTPVTTITDGINGPTGLGFDDGHNLWVANDPAVNTSNDYGNPDAASFTVAEFGATNGTVATSPTTTIVGQNYSPSYEPSGHDPYDDIDYPQGMLFVNGNLWLTNQGNGSIVEFTAATLASAGANTLPDVSIGNASYVDAANGTTDNSLEAPEGVTFDDNGNMWVSNDGNSNSATNGGNPNYTLVEFAPNGPNDTFVTAALSPETTLTDQLSAPADVVVQDVTSSSPPPSNQSNPSPPPSSGSGGSAPVVPSGPVSTVSTSTGSGSTTTSSSPAPASVPAPALAPGPAPQAVAPLARMSLSRALPKLVGRAVQVKLSCLAGTSCVATGTMTVARKAHGRLVHVVLARARFSMANGATRLVNFNLTPAGKTSLLHLAKHKHYRMTLTVVMSHGVRLVRPVTVS